MLVNEPEDRIHFLLLTGSHVDITVAHPGTEDSRSTPFDRLCLIVFNTATKPYQIEGNKSISVGYFSYIQVLHQTVKKEHVEYETIIKDTNVKIQQTNRASNTSSSVQFKTLFIMIVSYCLLLY